MNIQYIMTCKQLQWTGGGELLLLKLLPGVFKLVFVLVLTKFISCISNRHRRFGEAPILMFTNKNNSSNVIYLKRTTTHIYREQMFQRRVSVEKIVYTSRIYTEQMFQRPVSIVTSSFNVVL